MKFEDYIIARKKMFENQPFNKETTNLLWASNSLCGESGEFANVVKKVYRDKGGNSDILLYDLKDELGDIMWYWLFVCGSRPKVGESLPPNRTKRQRSDSHGRRRAESRRDPDHPECPRGARPHRGREGRSCWG